MERSTGSEHGLSAASTEQKPMTGSAQGLRTWSGGRSFLVSSSIRVFPRDARLDSKALIAGFHGIGATGFWSIKFLIQELHAKRLCYIDSEFAPAVSSTVNGEISTPYEIFGAGQLAFLKADVPPLRDNENKFL